MRKRLASALIRLAHYIYRPTVTETASRTFTDARGDSWTVSRPANARGVRLMPPDRRESRGWEQ